MRTVLRIWAQVRSNPPLLRVASAYFCFMLFEYATWIAMLVYAYERGGATTAGVVAVAQLVPAAMFAPVAAAYADRRPDVVLTGGLLVQALSAAATAAAMLAGAPAVLAYLGGITSSTAVTMTRPAVSATTPALAHSPDELAACNVVQGWAEQFGAAAAGLLTGALIGLSGPGLAFGAGAALALTGALAVTGLRIPAVALTGESTTWGNLRQGFVVLRTNDAARLTVTLLTALFILLGALDVLFVVLAVDVLGQGPQWAGYLNTAAAAGGIAAGVITAGLVGRPLTGPLLAAGALSSLAIALTAVSSSVAATTVLLAGVGAGAAVMQVAVRTLLQRTVPSGVVGRVFGAAEGLTMVSLGIGSIAVSALVEWGGATAALVGIALVLPLSALAGRRSVRSLDAAATVPVVEIALLRSLPHFATLPAPELEGLAVALTPIELDAGAVLFRQGDIGDRFYAIAEGQVEVSIDGRRVRTEGRGEGFGEIALMQDVPRTATVRAVSDTRLYALARDTFLTVLTGHDATRRSSEAVVEGWGADEGRGPAAE